MSYNVIRYFSGSIYQPDPFGGYWKQVTSEITTIELTEEEFEMAKKIEPRVITTDTENSLPGGLTINEPQNVAFSIVYDGNKRYSVVAIKFAAGATNSAGPVEVIASNLDLYEAQHEFKKATVNAGLFEIGLDK